MNPHFPILLVEDDEKGVLLVRLAFRQACLHNPLRIVKDKEQAIAYLRGEGKYSDRQMYPFPMLVIMGTDAHRKTGLEVLEWIRTQKEFQHIPIVMQSTSLYEADPNIQKARRLGITAHLTKTPDFKELQHVYKIVLCHWNLVSPALEDVDEEPALRNVVARFQKIAQIKSLAPVSTNFRAKSSNPSPRLYRRLPSQHRRLATK